MVMSPLILGILAFVGVATLVGGAALLFSARPASRLEDRLDVLTNLSSANAAKDNVLKDSGVLTRPLDDAPDMLAQWFARFGNTERLFEQADTTLTVSKLAAVSFGNGTGRRRRDGGHAGAGGDGPAGGYSRRLAAHLLAPVAAQAAAEALSATQLPDALEMIARALRAGQSLAFGFNAVATEMPAPIGKEFGRVFDEQNLGVALDDSLRTMCERVPNLDLRFFVTAVILQRQTGGDLSEILDKIGTLIRDRFRILGQVQGPDRRRPAIGHRAHGLAAAAVRDRLQPESQLRHASSSPIPPGKKMLAIAVVMQIIGAVVIKKIVKIKV